MKGKEAISSLSKTVKTMGKTSISLNLYGKRNLRFHFPEKDFLNIDIKERASEISIELLEHDSDVTMCSTSNEEMSKTGTDARSQSSYEDIIRDYHIAQEHKYATHVVNEEDILREDATREQMDLDHNNQCIPSSVLSEIETCYNNMQVNCEPPDDLALCEVFLFCFCLGYVTLENIHSVRQKYANEYAKFLVSANSQIGFTSLLRRSITPCMGSDLHSTEARENNRYDDSASGVLDALTLNRCSSDATTVKFPEINCAAWDETEEIQSILESKLHEEQMVTQMVRGLNMSFSGGCCLDKNLSKRANSQPSTEDEHQMKIYSPENSSVSSLRFRSSDHDSILSKSVDELPGTTASDVSTLENQSDLINQAPVIQSLRGGDEFPPVSRPSAGSSMIAPTVKDRRASETLPLKPEGSGNSTLLVPLVVEDKVTPDKIDIPADVEIKVPRQVSAKDKRISSRDKDEKENLQQQDQCRCMSVDEKYDESTRSLSPYTDIDQSEPQRNERLNSGILQLLETSVNTKLSCHTKCHGTQSRNISGCRIYSKTSQFHPRKKGLNPYNSGGSDVKCRRLCYHQKDKQMSAIVTRRWYSYMRRLAANGGRRGHIFAVLHHMTLMRSNNPHTTRRQLNQSRIIGQNAVLEKSTCIYAMRRQRDAQTSQNLTLLTRQDVQKAGTESATSRRTRPYPCDLKKGTEKETHATLVGTDERICHSGNNDFLTLDPGGKWGDRSSDKQEDANDKVCANSETESGVDEEFSATPSPIPCYIMKDSNNLLNDVAVIGSEKALTSFASKITSFVEPQVQVDGSQSPDLPSCTRSFTVSPQMSGGDSTEDLEMGAGNLRGHGYPKTPASATVNEIGETSSNGNAKSCSWCVGELLNQAGCSMETIKVKEQIRHEMRIGFASPLKTVYGLALFHLRNMDQWEIEELTLQTCDPFTPREKHVTNVLNELKYQGLKLGHVVEYFNREDSKRMDILQLIDRIHPNCGFCTRQIQLKSSNGKSGCPPVEDW